MSNPLCHFELMTTDPEKCQSFYGTVFGWKFDDGSMPGYTLVDAGQEPTGGIFKAPDVAPGPCANVYFQVDDIESTLERASESGGTIIVEKTEIPGVGHFGMFTDPEGIAVGIMQPANH